LVLRRGNRSIACEVCVKKTADYEIGNVIKCLAAGFGQVAVVCARKRKLSNLERAVRAAIPTEGIACVLWRSPEGFVAALFEWAAQDPAGGAIERGKRRKRNITLGNGQPNGAERQSIEREMLKHLAAAMRGGRIRRFSPGPAKPFLFETMALPSFLPVFAAGRQRTSFAERV